MYSTTIPPVFGQIVICRESKSVAIRLVPEINA